MLDRSCSGLLGVPEAMLLDGLVFAAQGTAIRDVFVAGALLVSQGRHAHEPRIAAAFEQAMRSLWGQ